MTSVSSWLVSMGVTQGFLALLLGGVFGALFRAYFSGTQQTWSRKTVEDTLIGGAVSTILPNILASIPILDIDFSLISPAGQFMLAFGLGLMGSWIYTARKWSTSVQAAAQKVGVVTPVSGSAAVQVLNVVAEETKKDDADRKLSKGE